MLLDQSKPTQANRVLVSEITCLLLASGAWAYLCVFQDGCTKHVVDWQVRADMPEAHITQRLAAGAAGPTARSRPHRSFRPCGQYVGNAYKALLRDAQARLSHSRRGKFYDNVQPGTTQAESLWSGLKTEELEARD